MISATTPAAAAASSSPSGMYVRMNSPFTNCHLVPARVFLSVSYSLTVGSKICEYVLILLDLLDFLTVW